MKFFASDSQAIYLSRRGPLPPPLRFFDVYYTGYPQLGFTVVGSASNYEFAEAKTFEPDVDFEQQEQPIATEDYLVSEIAQYGPQQGDMDVDQPMRIPGQGLQATPPRPQAAHKKLEQGKRPPEIKNFVAKDGEE